MLPQQQQQLQAFDAVTLKQTNLSVFNNNNNNKKNNDINGSGDGVSDTKVMNKTN